MALNNKRTTTTLIKGREGTNFIDSTITTIASSSISSDIFSNDPIYSTSTLSPILYHMDLLQEDIDELRRFTTGSMQIPSAIGGASSAGDIGLGTEVIILGGTSNILQGAVFYKTSTSWGAANATSATLAAYGFLGISKGDNMADGFVTRGIVYVATDPGGSVGDLVYLSTTNNRLTTTAPSANGNVVRVVGHKVGTNLVYFNPSTNWVELSV
jgi:hypothetical protein